MILALAGNPNSGKTTLFNRLTGSKQFVGNWPGVTVEKKEGKIKGTDITVQDLPGIYSLSPYSLEEVIARDYLIQGNAEVILNIVDASNLQRNLYLTTQLLEMDLPVVVALNMMDVVEKKGDRIDIPKLSKEIGCPVYPISALKGEGIKELLSGLSSLSEGKRHQVYDDKLSHTLAQIEGIIGERKHRHWYGVKAFEGDEKALEHLNLSPERNQQIQELTRNVEELYDDEAASIITAQRYSYIQTLISKSLKKKAKDHAMSTSDKIDRIVTNRYLALPIFVAVMFFVYFSAVHLALETQGMVGDNLFGEGIVPAMKSFVENLGASEWLVGLVSDGIISGVGAVLSFVPQMLVLFFMLAILEDIGYMSRIAFIMDRLFRKFGLSGKSFIPMLVGTGCSVPGIMASRTIENERDRRMTIINTSFIPCGAKLPVIALIVGTLFGGVWWMAPVAYFCGISAVILSGIILKKTRMFAGDPAPFVMELPAYHLPSPINVLRSTWERGWSFIKRAGTVILAASIFVWFTSSFGFEKGSLVMLDEEIDKSILATIGSSVAFLFKPLGFGNWQGAVASVLGLVAKEEVVAFFGVIYGITGDALEMAEEGMYSGLLPIMAHFTKLSAFSFLLFNLFCPPCFAAIGAIKREMNSPKWTWFTIGYLLVFAYVTSFIFYQLGLVFTGEPFTMATGLAVALLLGSLYLLFRPTKKEHVRLASEGEF